MVFPQILGVIESGIGPVCRQQLLMGALLGDAAVPDHQDAVGGPDGGEPVGDDEGGAAPAQLVEGVLNFRLGDAVQSRGGLVQDQEKLWYNKT